MTWQSRVFNHFKLYAVTDLDRPAPDILKKISLAYQNGVDIVQLRSKVLPDSEKLKLGLAIRKIATKFKKLYFMNDSLDLAILTHADGLHIGQNDIPARDIRSLCHKLKRKIFLGLSTHSEAQAVKAMREPIDYFAVGPVFETPTKPTYRSVGLKLVQKVSRFAVKPWVAIGGINEGNINQVLSHGASRVAVVRAIFQPNNPTAICNRLSQILEGNHHV